MARSDRRISRWAEEKASRWGFKEYAPGLSELMPNALRFASDLLLHWGNGVSPYWFTVLGPSGVGKTFLLGKLFRMLANHTERWPIEQWGRCAHVIPGKDLKEHDAPAFYSDFDLLYIEDIGTRVSKGSGAVTNDRTTELLLYRAKKWTIIDSNLSLGELADVMDGRIASRLKRDGSLLVELPRDIPDFNFQ